MIYEPPKHNQSPHYLEVGIKMAAQIINTPPAGSSSHYEFIDSKELAQRWCLPESWVREQVRSRSTDPLPHVKFGKYVRFRWGSPELETWAERRIVGSDNHLKIAS